jgi:hypothetical protein
VKGGREKKRERKGERKGKQGKTTKKAKFPPAGRAGSQKIRSASPRRSDHALIKSTKTNVSLLA